MTKAPARQRTPVPAARSTVSLKLLMAVTGILLVLFLFAHMAGNLKIFVGPASFDHYAAWLRTLGAPALPDTWFLWIQRTALTVALVGHVTAAVVLARRARRARPVRYAHRPKVQGSYAARTMRWGGVIILLFVIWHILDLTVGVVNPAIWHILDLTVGVVNPAGGDSEPSQRVIAGFAPDRWYVTLFYVLAVVAVGFHLRHGLFSAVRTLGQRSPRGERRARQAALALSLVLVIGYLSVPFAVLTGLVK